MRARAFEFLFLTWALATLAVHFDYMQDVVAFEHAQRAEQRLAQVRHWRQLARDELRLRSLHDEIEILQREAEALAGDEADVVESIDEMLERWLIVREVWREA